jgi:dienelactone hydrolase
MDAVRTRLASLLGLAPPSSAPEIRLIEREVMSDYSRTLLEYATADGESVTAFLFEPLGPVRHGGVLALHQHNSQWTIGKSEIAGLVGDPFQAFGPALARRGLVVLAPDLIGFESRLGTSGAGASRAPSLSTPGSAPGDWLQYYNQMAHRLVQGDLLMRKMIADAMTAVSVLQRIDTGREATVGAIGHSLGGIVSLFFAALDTRVQFACTSGAVGSYRQKLADGTGLEMSLIIPGIANELDFDDLIRCIAPRMLFVVSSDEDPATADAEEIVKKAQPAFESSNCPEHLQHLRVKGPHGLDHCRFSAIVDWVAAQCQKTG